MAAPTKIALDYKPRDWQRKCHEDRKRFTVLAVHRRAGKTTLAVMELLDKAIACQQKLGVFVYLAPLLKQAENISWALIKQVCKPLITAGVVTISEGDLKVTFRHNGASVRLFGANNPEEIRGMGIDGVVVDEVAQIDPHVWDEIVQPTLSDRKGWAWFIGTPNGINLFSKLFFKATGQTDWHAARFTVYDTGAIDAGEVERLRQPDNMTPNAFAREYMCDFSAASDEQLISMVDAELASKRTYKEQDISHSPRVIGVDPARFGDDRSVIFRRQGLQAFAPIVLQGVGNMDLASRVANEIVTWRPDAVFIDSGAGAGVIDRLRQLGHDVIEVPFGGRAIKSTQFVNRRSEMWWGMKEWLQSGGAIPDDNALKQELATPVYSFDGAGRKLLESKDTIKKRLSGGGSPDRADGLCLTFAEPLAARDEFADRRPRMQHAASQDSQEPYDHMKSFEQEWKQRG